MRYAYHDLGEQQAGNEVVVRWRGSPADVMLVDAVNFCRYRDGTHFTYEAGGHYRRTPARLTVPETGSWFVVADLRGYSLNAEPTVEVVSRGVTEQHSEHRMPVVANKRHQSR